MVQRARMGKVFISIALTLSLCFTLAVPALAGRGGFGGGGGMSISGGSAAFGGGSAAFGGGSAGFGGGFGGMRGGFSGTRSGFVVGGSSGGSFHGGSFHGGRGFHGGKNFHRCCVSSKFFTGFVFGSFPAPFYVEPWPWDWDWYVPPYPSQYGQSLEMAPGYPPAAQSDIAATIPREACYVTGCYRLQGDGVSVPFQWVWVPAPPPPPAVIPYPSGRYELRGPSRWEWVPNPSSSSSSAAPSLVPASSRVETSPASAPSLGLFRWTDDQGVTHWTQGLDAVPERYRPKPKPGVTAEGTL